MEEATLIVAKVSARHCKVFPWYVVMVGVVLVLFPDRSLDSRPSSNIAVAMCVESGAMPGQLSFFLASSEFSGRKKRSRAMDSVCSCLVTPTYRDYTPEKQTDIADLE
jgi:hypothetical protein